MSSSTRLFFAVVLGIALIMGGAAAAFAAVCHFASPVELQIHESDGTDLSLNLPGPFVRAAIDFVPISLVGRADANLRRILPIVHAAVKELDRIPDAVLVEVQDGQESVRVEKAGGRMIIDVRGNGDTVHVAVPFAVVKSVVDKLGEAPGWTAGRSSMTL